MSQPLHTPVTVVLPGRRNNPPEKGIRSLAVFNPVHYLDLPEAFGDQVTFSVSGISSDIACVLLDALFIIVYLLT